MRRAVAIRLGENFADDVLAGYVRQVPQEDAEILEEHGVISQS
jgi:hypothetical protein